MHKVRNESDVRRGRSKKYHRTSPANNSEGLEMKRGGKGGLRVRRRDVHRHLTITAIKKGKKEVKNQKTDSEAEVGKSLTVFLWGKNHQRITQTKAAKKTMAMLPRLQRKAASRREVVRREKK